MEKKVSHTVLDLLYCYKNISLEDYGFYNYNFLYDIVSIYLMNRNLIYSSMLAIVFITALSMITQIESFNSINAQVDPSQDPVQPIPPSNDTNTNQTTPIVFSQ
jgi:hypothetical protein